MSRSEIKPRMSSSDLMLSTAACVKMNVRGRRAVQDSTHKQAIALAFAEEFGGKVQQDLDDKGDAKENQKQHGENP